MKKIIKVSLIVFIILFAIVFLGARYGWRLFGFDYCISPQALITTKIDVRPDAITIQGDTTDSAPAFIGYIYKIDGDKMYIGLKYNLLFGFFDRDGRYDIKINCNSTSISSIYFNNKSNCNEIWNRKYGARDAHREQFISGILPISDYQPNHEI